MERGCSLCRSSAGTSDIAQIAIDETAARRTISLAASKSLDR
jgi:hypothetical protein